MTARTPKIPAYRLHRPTGQAVVRIDGHDCYLGKHGTDGSRERYDRLIAEWLTAGRPVVPDPAGRPGHASLSVNELLLAYWQYAQQHYRSPEGTPTQELDNLRHALRHLRKLYGSIPAKEVGPLALRAVQREMVQSGLCRTTINARINRVRRLFKWAASVELLPPSVHQALQTVPGLQKGRCAAPEPEDVTPVPLEHVEATLPFLPDPVAALVRVQLLTGCRAGEVMVMRAMDLNTTGAVWRYWPGSHKNKHRGLERVIYLGPQAQAVIRPFLTTDLQAFLFSPRRYVEAMHARRSARRLTRRTPSELRRQRKEKPLRKPAERYDRRSYRQAILRACKKAGVPPWSPLQLRHTAATFIRSRFGVEAARVILGHSRIETSQIYAERDLGRAEKIMAEIG
jgi:integrase